MQMAEAKFSDHLLWSLPEAPRQPDPQLPASEDQPDEPWLPARDVTLMTLAAFAVIAFASLFH